jgi:hypothetical protein
MEMAWHDCYGEISPPEEVVDAVLLCSWGTLDGMIDAIRMAVRDPRDVLLWASTIRERGELESRDPPSYVLSVSTKAGAGEAKAPRH